MLRIITALSFLIFSVGAWANHTLELSSSSDRSSPVALEGATVSGDIYVFLQPESDVEEVTFQVDGVDHQRERYAPFDLAGTGDNLQANPFDTTQLVDGVHSVGAEIKLTDGSSKTISASFNVSNGNPALTFDPATVSLTAQENGSTVSTQVNLDTSDGGTDDFDVAVSSDSPWLSVSASSSLTPADITVTADPVAAGVGTHTATVTATSTAGAYESDTLDVTFTVNTDSYALLNSGSSTREPSSQLEGQDVSGNIYVFIAPETNVSGVDFYLDDPTLSGTPIQSEGLAPYDFAGTRPDDTAYPFDTLAVADGSHVISAAITLDSGEVRTVSSNFTVSNGGGGNAFPTAEFTVSCTDLNCDFDASASADSDGTITDYAWDFGDGSGGSGALVSHGYAAAGTYTVTLTVTDDQGAIATATQDVSVTSTNADPTADFSVSCTDLSCDFDASASTDSDGTITDYAWEFGDGDIASGITTSHTYAGDDTYTVTLTVTDDEGAIDSTTQQVTVSSGNDAPTADITFTCTDLTCDFDGSGSTDSDGTITDYSWDFGDGATGTGATVSHTYGSDGNYTVTLTVTDDAGASAIATASVDLTTGNTAPTASFVYNCSGLDCSFDGTGSDDPDGSIAAYDWTFGDGQAGSGSTPSHSYGAAGDYDVTLTVTDDAGDTGTVTNTVSVSTSSGCASISLLACDQVRHEGDLVLDFGTNAGGLPDGAGVGTGFTMVDPPSSPGNPDPDPDAPGLWPQKLQVDTAAGVLRLQTTKGIQYEANNDLDNALGVGLNVPSTAVTIGSRLVNLPSPAPGGWAQAGVWYGSADDFGRGTAEDNLVKMVVASPSSGEYVLQAALEMDGTQVEERTISIPADTGSVQLNLVANPADRSVQARYDLGNGPSVLTSFRDLPEAWFSFDQAGIDPGVATRSFGGIFGTHRKAGTSLVFNFDEFTLTEEVPLGGASAFEFDKWQIPVSMPTAMAWGPDDRLYVAELFGKIHAFTLDRANRTVVDEEIIDAIPSSEGGGRLTLGLAVDPESTASDVTLWVAHSDGSLNNGQENSGKISRVSGPSLGTVEDRITGLPRAIANHAVNHIHFGPDGRLYISAGGNTGAGAPNTSGSEFGERPEQPLSAAVLVADVKDPNFQGDCATPIGQFGVPSTCDVSVYASGLRNSYDHTWHRNGYLYATDNGLGVAGTVPPATSPPCTGFGDTSTDDPGTQPDLLHRIQQGKYYGHPNPYRDECVFKDGTFQGASPLPNYEPPLMILGDHLSANGVIEYRGDAFYSKLMGQLLISNFSVGDSITRVELSFDGKGVSSSENLIDGFTDPLPLTQDPEGNIYVGELNANQVTVLEPLSLIPAPVGAWVERAPAPEQILDAGGGAVDGKLYVVGGKTDAGHVSSVHVYDPVQDSWSTAPSLPGEAVENPAVTSFDGKLYVFGGSTGPFSGAVTNAAVYDPASGSWTSLPSMTTARGGARAVVLDGKIHVVGGMGADGASLSSVEVYDPATGSWSAGTPMQTRRDNPGAAVVDGKLYVFGGRTRESDGTEIDGTLSSMEIYDPAADSWTFGPFMPTGRRAMAVGTISGRILVMGGERPVASANEEYDPETDQWRSLTPMTTPRHGAASATIRGATYVVGGGPSEGTSFTDANEMFVY